MQWVFIAMLVLLLSVILHIFYFAAAGTAAYSAAADAGIVSIFVAASVIFHRTGTHAFRTVNLLFRCRLLLLATGWLVFCFAWARADTINTAVTLPSLPIDCWFWMIHNFDVAVAVTAHCNDGYPSLILLPSINFCFFTAGCLSLFHTFPCASLLCPKWHRLHCGMLSRTITANNLLF